VEAAVRPRRSTIGAVIYAKGGKVIVMRSNLRWCLDGFEFTCWNRGIVCGAFVIDACDREVLAWRAVANSGFSSSDIPSVNGADKKQ